MSRYNDRDSRPPPPRERSPARSYRPGGSSYSNFGSRQRDFSGPYNDAPRGPRGVNDTPRAPSSTAPRGRGAFGGRFEPRDSRDAGFGNDRLYEGGDRYDPRRRSSPPRDRRDSRDVPRQLDTDRAVRQERGDGPPSAGSNPSDPGFRPSGTSFRGAYRGRGGDFRDRGRPRSRSRERRERDRSTDSRDLNYRERERTANEARYTRDRADDRDGYARRADPPNRIDTRDAKVAGEGRGAAPQLAPQNEKGPVVHATPPDRSTAEPRRDYEPARRGSAVSDHIRDARREMDRADPPAGRPDLQRPARPASPPPSVPAVPAFGFRTPAAGVTSLSWKNPDLAKTAPAAGSAQPPKTAPTAPKALTNAPPTAPKADRALEKTPSRESLANTSEEKKERATSIGASPSPNLASGIIPEGSQQAKYPSAASGTFLNPPSAPRAMTSPQPFGRSGAVGNFGRATSPVSVNAIPTGPKASSTINASPRMMSSVIPTGPRAERGPPPSTNRNAPPAPTAPKSFKTNSQLFARSSVVPVKRDVNGFERERSYSNEARPVETAPLGAGASQGFGTQGLPVSAEANHLAVKQEAVTGGAQQEDVHMADVPPADPKVSPALEDQPDSFPMSEDEEDEGVLTDMAEFLEEKFLADKNRLEGRRTDLSTPDYRPTLLFPELSRLVAMRAMVNNLSYRSRTGAEKKESVVKTKEVPREIAPPLPPPIDIAALQDEDGDQIMSDAYSSRESSFDRMSTPDPDSLPYLEKGPSTPLSDPDPFSVIKREVPEDGIKQLLKQDIEAEALEQFRLRQEFREQYGEWRRNVNQLDREKEEAEHAAKQCSPESVPSVLNAELPVPALPTPTEGGRRTHRFASEYEIQRVMEISLREEEEKKQKEMALREAQVSATADREADIPDLLPPSEAKRRMFEDVSQARRPEDALRIFDFVPPVDDFSEEEDRIMREVYKEYTKQWGKIARVVGRTYKECINHYYASKWDRPYKSRVGGRKGRGARGGRKPAGRQARSALVPAEDAAEAEVNGVPMVTESGRPKRAAAPTWPKDSDQDQNVTNNGAGKRNGKGEGKEGEAGAEKTGRRKAKEKAPKKTARNQPLAARPTASPQKVDREIKDKMIQPQDLDGTPWMLKDTASLGQTEHMPPLMPQPHVYPEANLTVYREAADIGAVGGLTERPRSHSNTTQRQGASSYWSVTEEQDFQRCLEHYGTDFQAISNHMGTKTHTMIKNHYQKFVNDGKHVDLIQKANEATQRRSRGEDMGPPPMPSQPPKRHGRYDASSVPVPRSLAPNSEMTESEQSPPAPVAVPYGMSPQFNGRAGLPQQPPRSAVPAATHGPGHRSRQVGPMMGFFGDDVRPAPQNNTIRPLIAPPEEPLGPRGPERIKTEFRPAELDQESHARQERDRELERLERERLEREYTIRRQAEFDAQKAQRAAEMREQERMFQRPGPAGHTPQHAQQPSIHGASPAPAPAPEHVRHDSRQHVFGAPMPAAAAHISRGNIVDLTGPQTSGMPGQPERRPQSPSRPHIPQPHMQQVHAPSAAPSPAPSSTASKEAPRRSNLMSLLNSEPEQEKPKPRASEPVVPAAQQYRIATTMQSETPSLPTSTRDNGIDRPYSRPTYPPAGQHPATSALSTPTNESGGRESLPPMSHRDSWPGNRQAPAFQQTNSPGLHAQHVPPVPDRAPLFSREYRASAFGGLNGPTRANPSPPPSSTPFGQHSRTPSYSHPQHQTPTSSVPIAAAIPPPSLHGAHYGQREQLVPGQSPHLGPQHHPLPNGRPEFGLHPRHPEQPRESLFERYREREREAREAREREQLEYSAARARDQREREAALQEREYQQQQQMAAQQQRFGHHTPPINQQRYAPPQAVPERSTAATPLSHVGYPPYQDPHAQSQRQREIDYNQELQRRDFERERSRQSRIHNAAAEAEELQRRVRMEAEARRVQEQQQYRRADERYPGMPPR